MSTIVATDLIDFTAIQTVRVTRKTQIILISVVVVLLTATPVVLGQDNQGLAPARLSWNKVRGIETYRLQIATDEQFRDVLFDGPIKGSQYIVTDLKPGRYYWRIAPSSGMRRFINPKVFEVKRITPKVQGSVASAANNIRPTTFDLRSSMAIPGWSAATGEIVQLLSAPLRGATSDFIGVNSAGTIFALDSAHGIALWTAQFQSPSSKPDLAPNVNRFRPVLVQRPGGVSVIVASNKGVRALDGATGREIWKTELGGHLINGVVISDDGKSRIYLSTEDSNRLFVVDGNSGELETTIELREKPVASPVLLVTSEARSLLVPLRGGILEIRSPEGRYLHSVTLGSEVTAAPAIVNTTRGPMVLIGLKEGLAAFEGRGFQPLGRIAIGGNAYPVGALAVVDLHNDKRVEVVMTTNDGRVIAVDVVGGKIVWSANVPVQPSPPVFADLNGDGWLDIILPGIEKFAVALSGTDGSLVWDSGKQTSVRAGKISTRSLALARVGGRLIIVGNDYGGLRALEISVPPGTIKP